MRDYVKRVTKMLPKLSQEQVKEILDSISKQNEMLDSVLESLTNGLVVVDNEWKIIKINKIAERYISVNFLQEEVKYENFRFYEMVNESEIQEFLKNCAQNNLTNVNEEFTITNPGGRCRFVTVSIFSLVCEGEMKGNIIKFYDITEKRTGEIKLRRLENMAGLTNLAAGMAHEIKNPLGAMGIHIQLIQRALKKARSGDGLLPEKKFVEDHLDVVNEEIENLNKLVMDFLFAVRPVKADLTLKNPEIILENIVEFFSPEFNKSSVQFSLEKSGNKTKLLIDEKLFREVIINIVQNCFSAIKEKRFNEECKEEFNKDKGQNVSNPDFPCHILIKTELKFDKYYIFISDNGSGMTNETLERIFEPYYTTKASGTGLGMTVVYKIIKEFSGDIQVSSKLNEGSVFTIILPVPQLDKKMLSKND